MEEKILNPLTFRLIKVGGKTYKDLLANGYTHKQLVKFTKNPEPIFPHTKQDQSKQSEHDRLKELFFNNPGVDPRNPNKRVYKNKKPFLKLVEEFGDPYKAKKNKSKTPQVKTPQATQTPRRVIKPLEGNLPGLLATISEFLSPEDLFSLYISNKELQAKLNEEYQEKYGQSFIAWLRQYLKNQYEQHLADLERERAERNETLKREAAAEKKRRAEILKEIAAEEKATARQRAADERLRQEILADEQRLRDRYEREERIRQMQRKNDNVLARLGIHNKADYRKWILKNHPDKGGDSELFRLAKDEAERMGY